MFSLFRINLLRILKSAGLWISIIFITFFLAFAPRSFGLSVNPSIPNASAESIKISLQVSAAIIVTGLLVAVITMFGESYVKIKGSLIYENTLLNNKPKYEFYISTILPIVIYTLLVMSYSLILVSIFDAFEILNDYGSVIDWGNINYGWLLWSITWTIILGISISLLISTFTKNINVYISITWAYLFLIFFFGGSSVPIFLIRGDDPLAAFMWLSFFIPNSFSNFLFVNSFSNTITYDVLDILDIVLPVVLSIIFIGIKVLIKK